jgi:hypothetical protein
VEEDAEQVEFFLERAGARDKTADEMGDAAITNFKIVKPAADRGEDPRARMRGGRWMCEGSHRKMGRGGREALGRGESRVEPRLIVFKSMAQEKLGRSRQYLQPRP